MDLIKLHTKFFLLTCVAGGIISGSIHYYDVSVASALESTISLLVHMLVTAVTGIAFVFLFVLVLGKPKLFPSLALKEALASIKHGRSGNHLNNIHQRRLTGIIIPLTWSFTSSVFIASHIAGITSAGVAITVSFFVSLPSALVVRALNKRLKITFSDWLRHDMDAASDTFKQISDLGLTKTGNLKNLRRDIAFKSSGSDIIAYIRHNGYDHSIAKLSHESDEWATTY